MHMKNLQRRLHKLEQMPQFQPPPSPRKQFEERVVRRISNEDLDLMIAMATDAEAGVERTLSERELAVMEAYYVLREAEARRLGFRSFAQAERIWGPGR
jgi:hypothetical protein